MANANYPELLLPLWGHEALLLPGRGLRLEAGANLQLLAIHLRETVNA